MRPLSNGRLPPSGSTKTKEQGEALQAAKDEGAGFGHPVGPVERDAQRLDAVGGEDRGEEG